MRVVIVLREIRDIFASDQAAALNDLLNLGLVLLDKMLREALPKLLQEEKSGRAHIHAQVCVAREVDGRIDEDAEVGAQHLGHFEEVGEGLEDRLDQVLLRDVDRVQHKWDQVWILLQHLRAMISLSQVVHGHNSKSLKRGMIRLQVLLDDRVELLVVCANIGDGEVLDHNGEEQHGELLLHEFLRLRELEHQLEELGPLLLGDQNLAKLADYLRDVLLDERNWLADKLLQKKRLCLDLIISV